MSRPAAGQGGEPLPESYWTWPRFLAVSVFWFALSFNWSMLLTQVLQFQADRLAPPDQRGSWLAVLAGAGAACSALTQILAGYLSDRTRSPWGRRRPYILAGTVLGAGGLALMASAQTFAMVVLAVMTIQLTVNIANGPYQALIPDLVPRRLHGTASMWMGLFQHVAQAAGPLVASRLLGRAHPPGAVEESHLGLLMAIDIALLVALMLVTVLAVREPSSMHLEVRPGGILDAFRVPLRPYPDFVRLLISRAIINMGLYTATGILRYYVQYSLGLPPRYSGDLLAGVVVAGIVGGIPVGPLADRFSKVKLIYLTNGATALAAVLFILARDFTQAFWVGLVLGLGYGAFTVVDWALACNLMPRQGTARYMGIWNLCAVIPQMMAPALAGPLSDWIYRSHGPEVAYRAPMALILLYLVAGTALLAGIKERPEDPAPAPAGKAPR
jgi:MFS family permease